MSSLPTPTPCLPVLLITCSLLQEPSSTILIPPFKKTTHPQVQESRPQRVATQPAHARSCLKVGVNHLPVHKCSEHLPLLMLPELFYIHVVLTPKRMQVCNKAKFWLWTNPFLGSTSKHWAPARQTRPRACLPGTTVLWPPNEMVCGGGGDLNARICTGREPGKLLEKSDPERSKGSISDFYLSRQVLFL